MTKSLQSKSKLKILIVGQGIAGTVLSHSLLAHNQDITIIDDNHHSAASMAASGTYSPMVLKRLVKSWNIDSILPSAVQFYEKLEQTLDLPLIDVCNHFRKIAQESELKEWKIKGPDKEYDNYVGDIDSSGNFNANIHSDFGFGTVKNSGKIHMKNLIFGSKAFLSERIRIERFDHSAVVLCNEHLEYKSEKFDRIIFCEGYKVQNNPFFPNASMKPVKGENLYVKIPNLNLKKILKSSIHIIPLDNDTYNIGSTYNWKQLDEIPSEEAKDYLLNKLKEIVDLPFEIINQSAGVRPSVKDRRPIIGHSFKSKLLLIFNGLGAKGLMLSPYYAESLCQYIINGKPIDTEVNINRF